METITAYLNALLVEIELLNADREIILEYSKFLKEEFKDFKLENERDIGKNELEKNFVKTLETPSIIIKSLIKRQKSEKKSLKFPGNIKKSNFHIENFLKGSILDRRKVQRTLNIILGLLFLSIIFQGFFYQDLNLNPLQIENEFEIRSSFRTSGKANNFFLYVSVNPILENTTTYLNNISILLNDQKADFKIFNQLETKEHNFSTTNKFNFSFFSITKKLRLNLSFFYTNISEPSIAKSGHFEYTFSKFNSNLIEVVDSFFLILSILFLFVVLISKRGFIPRSIIKLYQFKEEGLNNLTNPHVVDIGNKLYFFSILVSTWIYAKSLYWIPLDTPIILVSTSQRVNFSNTFLNSVNLIIVFLLGYSILFFLLIAMSVTTGEGVITEIISLAGFAFFLKTTLNFFFIGLYFFQGNIEVFSYPLPVIILIVDLFTSIVIIFIILKLFYPNNEIMGIILLIVLLIANHFFVEFVSSLFSVIGIPIFLLP